MFFIPPSLPVYIPTPAPVNVESDLILYYTFSSYWKEVLFYYGAMNSILDKSLNKNHGTPVNDSFTISPGFMPNLTGNSIVFGDSTTSYVTNGDFTTDTDWTKGSSWSIAGGVASCTGAAGSDYLEQALPELKPGKLCKATWTILNYVSGNVRCDLGGDKYGTSRSANGTYTEYIVMGDDSDIGFRNMFFVGDIDDVSIVGAYECDDPIIIDKPRLVNLPTGSISFIFRTETTTASTFLNAGGIKVKLLGTGQIDFDFEVDDTVTTLSSATGFNDGNPHRIEITWGASGLTLVIDNATADSDGASTSMYDPLGVWYVGADDAAGTNQYYGDFMEFCVWKTQRTLGDAQTLWDSGDGLDIVVGPEVTSFRSDKSIWKTNEVVTLSLELDNDQDYTDAHIEVVVDRELDTQFIVYGETVQLTTGVQSFPISWDMPINGLDNLKHGHRAHVSVRNSAGEIIAWRECVFDVCDVWSEVMRLFGYGSNVMSSIGSPPDSGSPNWRSDASQLSTAMQMDYVFMNTMENFHPTPAYRFEPNKLDTTADPAVFFDNTKGYWWENVDAVNNGISKERLRQWSVSLHAAGHKHLWYNEVSSIGESIGLDSWRLKYRDTSCDQSQNVIDRPYYATAVAPLHEAMYAPNFNYAIGRWGDQLEDLVRVYDVDGVMNDSAYAMAHRTILCLYQNDQVNEVTEYPSAGQYFSNFMETAWDKAKVFNPDFNLVQQNLSIFMGDARRCSLSNVYDKIWDSADEFDFWSAQTSASIWTMEFDIGADPQINYIIQFGRYMKACAMLSNILDGPLMDWGFASTYQGNVSQIGHTRALHSTQVAAKMMVHDHFFLDGGPFHYLPQYRYSAYSMTVNLYNRFLARYSYYLTRKDLITLHNPDGNKFVLTSTNPISWKETVHTRTIGNKKQYIINFCNIDPEATGLGWNTILPPITDAVLGVRKFGGFGYDVFMANADDYTLEPIPLEMVDEDEYTQFYELPEMRSWAVVVLTENDTVVPINEPENIIYHFDELPMRLGVDFTNKVQAWKDLQQTLIVEADGDTCGALADQAPDPNIRFQSSVGKEPVWKEDILNGMGAVLFSGGEWTACGATTSKLDGVDFVSIMAFYPTTDEAAQVFFTTDSNTAGQPNTFRQYADTRTATNLHIMVPDEQFGDLSGKMSPNEWQICTARVPNSASGTVDHWHMDEALTPVDTTDINGSAYQTGFGGRNGIPDSAFTGYGLYGFIYENITDIEIQSVWDLMRYNMGLPIQDDLKFHVADEYRGEFRKEMLTGTGSLIEHCTSTRYYKGFNHWLEYGSGEVPQVWDGYEWWVPNQASGTNSALYSTDATQTEWVKSNMDVAKDAVGMRNDIDGASTLTATAANATIKQTITQASGTHLARFFLRRKTGVGDIDISVNGTNWTTVTLTSNYEEFMVHRGSVTNPVIGIRIVTSGDEVEIGNGECHTSKESYQIRASSPLFTTDTAVTINRSDQKIALTNHDQDQGAYYVEIASMGSEAEIPYANRPVLGSRGTTAQGQMYFQQNQRFHSYDDTNGVSTPSANQPFVIGEKMYTGLAYDSTQAQMRVYFRGSNNEMKVATAAYDGAYNVTYGYLGISQQWPCTTYIRNIRGYDLAWTEGTAKIYALIDLAPPVFRGPVPDQNWSKDNAISSINLATYFTGVTPTSYTITTGSLPSGVTMNASGVISGTPTEFASSVLAVTGTHANGSDITNEFAYSVIDAAYIPTQPPAHVDNDLVALLNFHEPLRQEWMLYQAKDIARDASLSGSHGTAPNDRAVGFTGTLFSTLTSQSITFGDDTTDIAVNGDFQSGDVSWTKETAHWTIVDSGGGAYVARCSGGQSSDTDLYQTPSRVPTNNLYEITFTISNYVAGNLVAIAGDTEYWTKRAANGTFVNRVKCPSDGTTVGVRAESTFEGDVDNITVIGVYEATDPIIINGTKINSLPSGTISCCFRSADEGTLLACESGHVKLELVTATGVINFIVDGTTISSVGGFDDDSEYMVECAWGASGLTLVVNGSVEDSDGTAVDLTGIDLGAWYLGADDAAGTNLFTGMLQEPRIWKVQRTTGDASTAYNSGSPADIVIGPSIDTFRSETQIYTPTDEVSFELDLTNDQDYTDAWVGVEIYRLTDDPVLVYGETTQLTTGAQSIPITWDMPANGLDNEVNGHRAVATIRKSTGELIAEKECLFGVTTNWMECMRMWSIGANVGAGTGPVSGITSPPTRKSDATMEGWTTRGEQSYRNTFELFHPWPGYNCNPSYAITDATYESTYGNGKWWHNIDSDHQPISQERILKWREILDDFGWKFLNYTESSADEEVDVSNGDLEVDGFTPLSCATSSTASNSNPDSGNVYRKYFDTRIEGTSSYPPYRHRCFTPNFYKQEVQDKAVAFYSDCCTIYGGDGCVNDSMTGGAHGILDVYKYEFDSANLVMSDSDLGLYVKALFEPIFTELDNIGRSDYQMMQQNVSSTFSSAVRRSTPPAHSYAVYKEISLTRKYDAALPYAAIYSFETDLQEATDITFGNHIRTFSRMADYLGRSIMLWAFVSSGTSHDSANTRAKMATYYAERLIINDHNAYDSGPLSYKPQSRYSGSSMYNNMLYRFHARWSYYISHKTLTSVENAEDLKFTLTSSAVQPVYWQDSVYTRTMADGHDQYVIHLLNIDKYATGSYWTIPPVVDDIVFGIRKFSGKNMVVRYIDADSWETEPQILEFAPELEDEYTYYVRIPADFRCYGMLIIDETVEVVPVNMPTCLFYPNELDMRMHVDCSDRHNLWRDHQDFGNTEDADVGDDENEVGLIGDCSTPDLGHDVGGQPPYYKMQMPVRVNRPRYFPDVINGLGVVRFNGTDQWLESGSNVNKLGDYDYTSIAVFMSDVDDAINTLFTSYSTTSAGQFRIYSDTRAVSTPARSFNAPTNAQADLPRKVDADEWIIQTVKLPSVATGSNVEHWLNDMKGVDVTKTAATVNGYQQCFGASNGSGGDPFSGDFLYHWVFDGLLSDTDMKRVWNLIRRNIGFAIEDDLKFHLFDELGGTFVADQIGGDQSLLEQCTSTRYYKGFNHWLEYGSGVPGKVWDGTEWWVVNQAACSNNALYSTDATQTEWVKSNMDVAKDAVGMRNDIDGASTLTATAANATIKQSFTETIDDHTARFFLRRKTGTGDVDITVDDGTTWTTVTLTSNYEEFMVDKDAANPVIGIRIVTSGDEVEMGNGEFNKGKELWEVRASSPIFTTSSIATINRTNQKIALTNHDQDQGAYYVELASMAGYSEIPFANRAVLGSRASTAQGQMYFQSNDRLATYDDVNGQGTGAAHQNFVIGEKIHTGLVYDSTQLEMRVYMHGSGSVTRVGTGTYDGDYGTSYGYVGIMQQWLNTTYVRNIRGYDLAWTEGLAKISGLMP